MSAQSIYIGHVVHRRVRPVRHTLRYGVFSMLVDVCGLPELERRTHLFSFNRFNAISLFERDHGDGRQLNDYLYKLADSEDLSEQVERFQMLCYPRVFGYAFNPLTVYFGLDEKDQVRIIIYEVNNTFGDRQTYVLPVETTANGIITQKCDKRMYVSPFNDVSGSYAFHVTPPGETMSLSVSLRTDDGPVLNAFFHGKAHALTDRMIIRALLKTGWMTVKVIAGIHFEAARLWLKGLPLVPRNSE